MSAADASSSTPPRLYLRRRGRTTRAQARALAELSPRYCLPADGGVIDAAAEFGRAASGRAASGRAAPMGLEIGFGMGQALIQWAMERPDWNLLGIEVYQPGLGSAMLGLERHGIDNVRLLEAPAESVLEHRLAPACLDEARIFFPDPWPKKRHHKRRLIQPAFVSLIASRLKPGAVLWLATDWEPYGEWMVEVLDAEPALQRERAPRVAASEAGMCETCAGGTGDDDGADPETGGETRPRTRFESRGRALGHRVWDLRYLRRRASTPSR